MEVGDLVEPGMQGSPEPLDLRRHGAAAAVRLELEHSPYGSFSRPAGASFEINSGSEFDKTILDHVALSASGLKCEVTITSLEDLDRQVVTQNCRSNEPDRHTADSARITVGYRLGCGASAEGHRAQSVEKGGFESTATGFFHAGVVVAVVPRYFGVAARHDIFDRGHILCHRNDALLFGEGVIGEFRSGGCGGGAEEDRRPPLFRYELSRSSQIE